MHKFSRQCRWNFMCSSDFFFQLKIAWSSNVIDELTEKCFYMIYRSKYKMQLPYMNWSRILENFRMSLGKYAMIEHTQVKIWIKWNWKNVILQKTRNFEWMLDNITIEISFPFQFVPQNFFLEVSALLDVRHPKLQSCAISISI